MVQQADTTLRQPGVFGQMTWDTYTVVLLAFRTTSSQETIGNALDAAASKLTSTFPFLAGQVTREGRSSTSSGHYSIVPYPPHAGKSPVIRHDCTSILPTFDELAAAKAPFSILDGKLLSPTKAMPDSVDYTSPAPVVVIQASFITGGVLLCFCSHHNALDMNGQGTLIKHFATACRDEAFDPKEIQFGNKEDTELLTLLSDGEKTLSHDNFRMPSRLNAGPPQPPPHRALWRYWSVSASKLAELKSLASARSSDAKKGKQQWISTNDALVAFFIQRLVTTRLASGRTTADDTIYIQRAVDGRSKLHPPIPNTFMGHMVVSADNEWAIKDIVSSDSTETNTNTNGHINGTTRPAEHTPALHLIASSLRSSLSSLDDFHIRSFATLLSRTSDKSTLFYGAHMRPGKDMMLTSWAGLPLYQHHFGDLLGKAEFVRRPAMLECEGLVYVMPKDRDGVIVFGVSLSEADYAGLKGDGVWSGMVDYIG